MMLNKIGTLALAAAAVVGCKKKDGDGGGASKGADSDLPDELAKWMPADVDKAWEGTWNGHVSLSTSGAMTMSGDPQALQIKDGKATAFNGKEEKTVDFAVKKPCEVGFMVKAEGGAVYTFSKKFVINNGKLETGEGAVGMRKGKAAVICAVGMDSLFTLDDAGKCLSWSDFGHSWKSKPATCTWSQKDGKDVLTAGEGQWAATLIAEGDVLRSEQFAGEAKQEQFKRAADYPAAKQWATDEAKKHAQ
jgi:hypothetical protein